MGWGVIRLTLYFAWLIIFCAVFENLATAGSQTRYMTEGEYQAALAAQAEIHRFVQAASYYEKKGQHDLALDSYLKAYEIDQCGGLVAVCRGGIADNYEAMGEYEKALEHVGWFFQKLKPSEPLFEQMAATKKRLLEKIAAQKRGGMVAESKSGGAVTGRLIADFQKSDYGSQKKYMEENFPATSEVQRLIKQAMLAEHAGKFREAKEAYAALLSHEKELAAIQGASAWPMVHAAVQRTAEVTGDETLEKEMLVWIRDQMMADGAPYRADFQNMLMPSVQDHLRKRIKSYNL